MENHLDTYLIVILVIVTLLLIVQAAVFVGLYFLARRAMALVERVSQLQTRAEYLINNTEPVLKMAHGMMTELREASGYIAQGSQHLTAITEMAKDEAASIRSLLGDSTALARREVERARDKADQVHATLARATDQFQITTELVQRRILEPAREFSYIMFGLRRAIEVLMAGNRLPVNRAYQDEEMFI
jgi:hypothetical protein